MTWPPHGPAVPYPGDDSGQSRSNSDRGARTELADAIRRANHRCIECGEPLSAPVWDEGEWIPESIHLPWCPVLHPGPAMLLEYHDILDALHAVGYGADYGSPVPQFSGAAA